MSRTLHIFRKDLWHFWKEVLLSWCLLGLYVWQFGAKVHIAHAGLALAGIGAVSGLTGFLLPLGWWVLVVRLVQDESLVGDRQFWLTRPYRWVELLASKLIFVLLFIHVPLLIAQLVMLRLAGFAPLSYLGGLFYMHGTLLVFTAMAFTIATVTATLVQAFLATFVVLFYGIGNSGVISSVPNSSMPHLQNPWDPVESLILLCAIIGVISLQYARRKTGASRGIIIGSAVLTTVVGVIAPYDRLIAKTYPLLSPDQDSALKVALDTRKPEKPSTPPRLNRVPAMPREENRVNIMIPLLASLSNENELVEINGMRVTIDLLGKQEWQSNWQPNGGNVIIIPDTGISAGFVMPKRIFESVKSSPVRVRIESALSVFRKGSEQWQVTAEDGDFPAPRLGLCLLQTIPGMLQCRAPLRGATRMLGSAHSAESTCENSDDTNIPNFTGFYWKLGGSTGPEPGISPVVEEPLYFGKQNPKRGDEARFVRLCPGTPMYFTSLDLTRRMTTVTYLTDIRLSDYRIVPASLGVGLGAVAR